MQNTVAGVAPPAPEVDYAELPEDALCTIYALLPAFSLRAAAASNSAWCRALRGAGPATRRRASWVHHWTDASVGASIQPADTAVCTGDGSWHPGGVALAATLHLRKGQDSGFRLTVDAAAPGDLLMGITLLQPEATPPAAAALDVGISDRGAPPHPPLEMGYHYMMGRRLDAVGEIQISPPAGGGGAGSGDGGGGGRAPRSIFYGGRSRRCCFATPSAQSSGPTMDVGPDGRSPGILAKLRHLGDWVEFCLIDGQLRATDHTGHTHVWGVRVEAGEVWVPTLAWTGSRASVRLAPPEHAPWHQTQD